MNKPFPILLIDDDPMVLDTLEYAAKYSFEEATFTYLASYREAVNYLHSLKGPGPRLILLDVDLKTEENGFTFLEELRAHPQGKSLPVVMLSAYKTDENVEMANELNSTSFVQKPFVFNEWKACMSSLKNYWVNTVTVPQVWFN
ncbi:MULTISPECIES: response regulator [Spirosoma]|uniref:Response regulator n=1 Tax=Spirosoma liriopis TaxID=2937440 RepID=A0ABT0HQU9_9BACT|nr:MULTISPECIES: response regulator [Spirosoma]MCK8494552.1 response regulator [Spirosoma liriopis]UHG89561.1 response regulator [Spirosoma oryzicola]